MAQRGACDVTRSACDWWADGCYCGDLNTRRYINGWRCIKHTPAAIRKTWGWYG
jgi:hypothetical protein